MGWHTTQKQLQRVVLIITAPSRPAVARCAVM